jgi:hypothetical protein
METTVPSAVPAFTASSTIVCALTGTMAYMPQSSALDADGGGNGDGEKEKAALHRDLPGVDYCPFRRQLLRQRGDDIGMGFDDAFRFLWVVGVVVNGPPHLGR